MDAKVLAGLVAGALLLWAGCFAEDVPDGARVHCSDGVCPPSMSCTPAGFCAREGDPCVEGVGDLLQLVEDGAACGTERVCAGGACVASRCGDGVVDLRTETCDDGNDVASDACTDTCTIARCGDGVVFPSFEECDDGNESSSDACLPDCTANVCGDGFLNAALEACDDGNVSAGDGCSDACELQEGWTCPEPGAPCFGPLRPTHVVDAPLSFIRDVAVSDSGHRVAFVALAPDEVGSRMYVATPGEIGATDLTPVEVLGRDLGQLVVDRTGARAAATLVESAGDLYFVADLDDGEVTVVPAPAGHNVRYLALHPTALGVAVITHDGADAWTASEWTPELGATVRLTHTNTIDLLAHAGVAFVFRRHNETGNGRKISFCAFADTAPCLEYSNNIYVDRYWLARERDRVAVERTSSGSSLRIHGLTAPTPDYALTGLDYVGWAGLLGPGDGVVMLAKGSSADLDELVYRRVDTSQSVLASFDYAEARVESVRLSASRTFVTYIETTVSSDPPERTLRAVAATGGPTVALSSESQDPVSDYATDFGTGQLVFRAPRAPGDDALALWAVGFSGDAPRRLDEDSSPVGVVDYRVRGGTVLYRGLQHVHAVDIESGRVSRVTNPDQADALVASPMVLSGDGQTVALVTQEGQVTTLWTGPAFNANGVEPTGP